MALFSVAVVNKNHKAYSKTLLLNTEKVGNFFYDSAANDGSGGTVFFYVESEDRKHKAVRYETAEAYTTFEDHFNEAMEKRRLNLQVVAYGTNDESWDEDVNIDANRIIMAYDDGTNGRVFFENGAFDVLQYKTVETISDIESESSTSASA
jgi:hypothetical protein